MSKSISAAVYETHGNPADVLRVESRPWPTPAADEAVVKMSAAPINPADLNQIEGKYPVRPELPATPGFEGAGVVVELGANWIVAGSAVFGAPDPGAEAGVLQSLMTGAPAPGSE
jgi:trans-2-enoyl-CoA reductase